MQELEVELRRGRPTWFGHVVRVERGVLRLVDELQVGGTRPPGRPRKI
jgi:hypothetical protein